MAKTSEMRLIELMVLKEDISSVLEFIGKRETFQFQNKVHDINNHTNNAVDDTEESYESDETQILFNTDCHYYEELKKAEVFLGFKSENINLKNYSVPDSESRTQVNKFITSYKQLENEIAEVTQSLEKEHDAYNEAKAFSNLQISYSELEHLSFLSMKIGKIAPENYENLKNALTDNCVVVSLGDDNSRILVASSKKGRFAMDTELNRFGFVQLEIPKDFQGVPQEVLDGLQKKITESEKKLEELNIEKANFAETHKKIFSELLGTFTIGVQIAELQKNLESTELVYRITGWIPSSESDIYMTELDNITGGRIAIREYNPFEVPDVVSGKEQVPVKLTHGKFVKSFERMIFSYGSPLYGTIDPTPFVALFFTLLFGIMFGDCGQGLVFVLAGILMAKKVINVGGWNKFAPIFMAIGISSSIMGLLTGEFFSNETLLEPFAEWVTGLFGNPHAPILSLMPSSDPSSLKAMFGVFGVAVGIGFIINSIGLIINIVNNIILKKYGDAFFGKNGLAGTLFFWYVIVLVLRIFLFNHSIQIFDVIILGITLFLAAFSEPFKNLLNGKRPVFNNGFGTFLISGIVEIIEIISGYLSNTISFVRVGAFALSHAVLDFLILMLTNMCGGEGSFAGILILILGNAIIIVLEGMIVAIQVIRLQYYEFFSKFFHENGKEFKPYKFEIK